MAYWTTEATKPYFTNLAKGKEIGHKLADLVDEKTCALLTLNWVTRHQHDKKGQKRSRSMGDIWIEEKGVFHPVNVKVGIVGSEGQPNMVSLKKLINGVLQRWIDSYYLLIVKFKITDSVVPTIYMVDLLDCFDHLTFDSGPGQIMLKAAAFFRDIDAHQPSKHTLREKLDRLTNLYADGERRLFANRQRDVEKYKVLSTRICKADNSP